MERSWEAEGARYHFFEVEGDLYLSRATDGRGIVRFVDADVVSRVKLALLPEPDLTRIANRLLGIGS